MTSKLIAFCIVCGLFVPTLSSNTTFNRFIITMWCPPPVTADMRYFQQLIDEGYNLTNISVSGTDPRNLNVQQSIEHFKLLDSLNRLEKNKHRPIYSRFYSDEFIDSLVLTNPVRKLRLKNTVNSLKNLPWFQTYQGKDEPSYAEFGYLAAISDKIRELDPTRSIYVNLHPSYATQKQVMGFGSNEGFVTDEDYRKYVEAAVDTFNLNLISYNNYIFHRPPNDSILYPEYFRNISIIREVALKKNIPFLNIIQSSNLPGIGWRLPTPYELRWQAYTTLAFGGKGICWFLYWGDDSFQGAYIHGVRQPIADELKHLNHEIKSIGQEMMPLTSTGVYFSGRNTLPGVRSIKDQKRIGIEGDNVLLATFQENGLENAFMIVNLDHHVNAPVKSVTIRLEENNTMLTRWKMERNSHTATTTGYWENKLQLTGNNRFQIALKPGEGVLFKLAK